MAIRIKPVPRPACRANSDSAFGGCKPRLHVASDLRKALHRMSWAAVRRALPGKRAARHSRGHPRVPGAKISAVHSRSFRGTSRHGAAEKHPPKADTAGRSRAHITAMGSTTSGGIGRTPLAENVRAVPCAQFRRKCRASNRRKIQHHPAMVSARGLQSRHAQTLEMRRMSCRRAEKPGNIRRLAAGHSDLRKVPSRRTRSGGIAMLRVPHLPRLEAGESR
jgi:hypothetical protein